MIKWDEYVSGLLSSNIDFDHLMVSIDGGDTANPVPPIIKVSIKMLEKMTDRMSGLNVFVFPEIAQTYFLFALMEVYHNICRGVLKSNYNPKNFRIGDKLKVGNAIGEYLGEEEIDGKEYISIGVADNAKLYETLEHAPVFQKVSTNRKLSSDNKFQKEMKKFFNESSSDSKLSYVSKMKTHMNSSTFCVTTVNKFVDQCSYYRINGEKPSDILFFGKADYKGDITNIGSGQMCGIPAIVCSSELYPVRAAVEKKHPTYSIIIDGVSTITQNQLDALDFLIQEGINIIYVTDTANSFDLDYLSDRGFNIWRWDEKSITAKLYNATSFTSDQRIKNCVNHSAMYLRIEDEGITDVFNKLFSHKNELKEQSLQFTNLFDNLSNLIFKIMRSVVPFEETDLKNAQQNLDDCDSILQNESRYIDDITMNDFCDIIRILRRLYNKNFSLKKTVRLEEYLKKTDKENLCLIISENENKEYVCDYWERWCNSQLIKKNITVLYSSEYSKEDCNNVDTTIICGWLGRTKMQKILYSYKTPQYEMLFYRCEEKWGNSVLKSWKKVLNNSHNKTIITKAFSKDDNFIQTENFDEVDNSNKYEEPSDDLEKTEQIIRDNKYRKYTYNNGNVSHETVLTFPVSFVGDFLAFYQASHKLISATKLIKGDADKIEIKLPGELKTGDFVVVRGTNRDLIRDMADVILSNKGEQDAWEQAGKWRSAINAMPSYISKEEICKKIKKAGCKRDLVTIKNWIEDEDVIAPQSIEDLQIIADVTGDPILAESLEEVYNAAKEVREACKEAGRYLSDQLKWVAGEELKKYENMNPANIWKPINIIIDNIGNIILLKVIDVGPEVEVDRLHTNRLIKE